MTVRRAAATDVDALVLLMHDFYAESGYVLNHAWAGQAFRALFANPALGTAWVIEDGGLAVGHIVLSVRFAMEFGGPIGYVDDLYVQPAYRGRGAAAAALAALLDECRARHCRAIEVEVAPDNQPAQAAYRRLGMRPGDDPRQHLRLVLA